MTDHDGTVDRVRAIERTRRREVAAEHEPLLVARPPLAGADLIKPFIAVAASAADVWVAEYDGADEGTTRVVTERFRFGDSPDDEAHVEPAGEADPVQVDTRDLVAVEWYGPLADYPTDDLEAMADGDRPRAPELVDGDEPRTAWERRERAEQVDAHRSVASAAMCGPQGPLTGYDVFGAIRSEVADSVLLAADDELAGAGDGDADGTGAEGGASA
jgi:hypothetical protein